MDNRVIGGLVSVGVLALVAVIYMVFFSAKKKKDQTTSPPTTTTPGTTAAPDGGEEPMPEVALGELVTNEHYNNMCTTKNGVLTGFSGIYESMSSLSNRAGAFLMMTLTHAVLKDESKQGTISLQTFKGKTLIEFTVLDKEFYKVSFPSLPQAKEDIPKIPFANPRNILNLSPVNGTLPGVNIFTGQLSPRLGGREMKIMAPYETALKDNANTFLDKDSAFLLELITINSYRVSDNIAEANISILVQTPEQLLSLNGKLGEISSQTWPV